MASIVYLFFDIGQNPASSCFLSSFSQRNHKYGTDFDYNWK